MTVSVREGVALSRMTTFRMGGVASRLWEPVRGDDLAELPCDGGRYRIVSGGSNLLVSDAREFSDVVSMRGYDGSVERLGAGRYRVGASVTSAALVRVLNADGRGGLEELASVPGLVGGLVCMNASVPSAGTCVSDHLVGVEAFEGGRVAWVPREECGFAYRTSRFLDGRSIVLSATFDVPEMASAESAARLAARRERVRRTQDRGAPNFGSAFAVCNAWVMALARRLGVGRGGVAFSRVASNWLLNRGGTFEDAMWAIRAVERLHALCGRPCEREVRVWE